MFLFSLLPPNPMTNRGKQFRAPSPKKARKKRAPRCNSCSRRDGDDAGGEDPAARVHLRLCARCRGVAYCGIKCQKVRTHGSVYCLLYLAPCIILYTRMICTYICIYGPKQQQYNNSTAVLNILLQVLLLSSTQVCCKYEKMRKILEKLLL